MPELAEVEYYRKRWNPGLGKLVRSVHVNPGARVFRETSVALIRRRLPGTRFEESLARGKQMMFRFSEGAWLGGHLGMSGKLTSAPADYPPERHDHLVLYLESIALVFTDPRMFGRIRFEVCPQEEGPNWWRELPPEVVSSEFSKERVAEFVGRRARTPIKSLLLEQSVFPGIGNWMADEICWRLQWHPARLSGEIDRREVASLWKTVRLVSRQALKVIGTDWGHPPRSWLFSHRWKEGGHCPRAGCGKALARADLRGRTTCWCPRCQGE